MTMAPPNPEPPDDDNDPSQSRPRRKTNSDESPRRPSTAKREPKDNSTKAPNGTTTPVRKASAQDKVKTPNTAPARARNGAKKAEPTLLGDFLLGRPSPSRNRRKSVDVVKAEMREDLVGKVQPPGKVTDRVKTWQKANAAAVIIDPLADAASQPDDAGGWEHEDDTSVDEEERLRIKFREGKKANARRKSKEIIDVSKHIPNAAPPKRVISDSHWMKQKKKSPPRSGAAIPKNFLQTTSMNPTVDKKISDWVKRNESEDSGMEKPKEKPRSRSRKTSRQDLANGTRTRSSRDTSPDDGIRVRASPAQSFNDGIRVRPSNSPADDGIRVTPSKRRTRTKDTRSSGQEEEKDPRSSVSRSHSKSRRSYQSGDDGIRIKPHPDDTSQDGIRVKSSPAGSADDGIRVKPLRMKKSRGPSGNDSNESIVLEKKNDKHLRVPSESNSTRKPSSHAVARTETVDDQSSIVSESLPGNIRRRKQTAQTPPDSLADVPFGNSAFSVAELPLGAEAGNTVKRPPPKRNQSFGVPKALKKVFNEGMKIAHDTGEPPRGGQNQPPSIESWLKGTSDPFVDKPGSPKPALEVPDSSSTSSRKASYNKDDRFEQDFTSNNSVSKSHKSRKEDSHDIEDGSVENVSPIETRKTRENLPSMAPNTSPGSPSGLKRTPATRNTSSVKAAKKLPLKDAFMDAFRGESSTSHSRSASNPFLEITGLREGVGNTSPRSADQRIARDFGDEALDHTSSRRSSKLSEKPILEEPKREPLLPVFSRRSAPTTGQHRLSTILSEVSHSTSSSATGTETGSEISQTTVTQDTVITGPTTSSLSRNTHRSQKLGLKRRLTKHSDLVSMLSLPDTVEPARKQSIRSARSIRTTRNHLETATVQDLMRELTEDEIKYKRELKTLVDGVIPVLLTCVLSKSDSATAAGLFNPHHDPSQNGTITKPIVDMGVALERLKSLHNRIPLADADAFIRWAQTAHRTYEDYLSAWRAGFQDVVVNLEPATSDKQLAIDDIARDENGDAVAANGERADVAYFLKRPLVRVKFLARTTKGLSSLLATAKSREVEEQYQDLAQTARRRHKEESARLEDEKANNTDPTRARDPRNLDLAEGVKIDRTRQVCAKDIFRLDLEHSTGQRVGCRVELILRDKPDDEGDLLICEMDEIKRFLLFPPLAKSLISARLGEGKAQVILMIRGETDGQEWHELLLLEADDPEAAEEWIGLIGSSPLPPQIESITDNGQQLDALVSSIAKWHDKREHLMSGGLGIDDIQVPIGERLRREEEEHSEPALPDRKRASRRSPASFSSLPASIKEESSLNEPVMDLNDAMNKAGALTTPKRPRAARYHGKVIASTPTTPKSDDLNSDQTTPTQLGEDVKSPTASDDMTLDGYTRDVNVPKVRTSSTPTTPLGTKSSTPLKEHMRPQPSPTTPTQEESPPPPPPHRSMSPKVLKNVPALDTKTPRASNRRTSSPLKHEYQPSDASGTSSAEDSDSETDSTGSYSESSDDEELESVHEVARAPVYGKRVSPSGSIYSLANTTLAPSNSASQGPYRSAPLRVAAKDTERHTVMSLSYWNEKGQWVDIYSGPCSLIIGPGWLRAYKMDDYHSNPYQNRPSSSSGSPDVDYRSDSATPLPLIAQELTPNVFMQRHTIDIHVRSPPMSESTLKCKGSTIRYHMLTPVACVQLYQSLYESSKNNMTYNKLEEERRVNAYGTYGAAAPSNRRNSWFGRRNSYRASARAPSEMVSEQSGRSSQSRISALRSRLVGGGMFNIAKSSIDVSQGGNRSGSTSLGSSEYSGITPPRTPTSMFSGSGGAHISDLGSENIRVRLYQLATSSKWEDKRYAYLTVTPPPPGRRQNSTLKHGLEKHIIVTRREHNHRDGPGEVIIDEVLGANCFQMVGVKGVMATIWDDIRGPNGEIGQIGARGGVSGRQRKYLFQTSWVAHANWIHNICSAGR